MCGISGILHWGRVPGAPGLAKKQAASQVHRGPDDDGHWSNSSVALSFRRLSILDLADGKQPMASADGRIQVVFNGEIYNHLELRRELESRGRRFRTNHSDTEVFVHGWLEWGEELFRRLNGMFAVALWDESSRELVLARDRYGIKPLYFAELPSRGLVFGSEVRAIYATGLIRKEVEPAHLREYFTFQNNWDGRTLFRSVAQIPRGSYWILRESQRREVQYWDYHFERKSSLPLTRAADRHREILSSAVQRQMQADVPVVSYLSGGIDSSAITALAVQARSGVRAYSCLFELTEVGADRHSDEREFSRAVADNLQIPREEMTVARMDLQRVMKPTIDALEYPRMGMSYANYLIAERVAKDAKVVLSGTGGDEIHGGYVGRYKVTPRVPLSPLKRLGYLLKRSRMASIGKDLLTVYKMNLEAVFAEKDHADIFTPEFLKLSRDFSAAATMEQVIARSGSKDPWDQVMYVDAATYLAGLLTLEDKLSMIHSLEARVPLLDNELVDYVSTLPWHELCDGDIGKIVFRESVRPLVPQAVADKPKMGFGPPDASWYRGPLRAWIEEMLSGARIRRRGILRPAFVEKLLNEHMSGRANHVGKIWSLLSIETWCETHEFSVGEGI